MWVPLKEKKPRRAPDAHREPFRMPHENITAERPDPEAR